MNKLHRTGLCAFFVFLMACSASRTGLGAQKWRQLIAENPVFAQSHCGFVLYDLEKQRTVYSHNGERYFTPASNAKIFTLYTSLRMLSDSIPALKYAVRRDSLFFWGTGDPSFLHPDLKSTRAYDFLNRRPEKLFYISAPYEGAHFGPGWAWDDYNDADSPEKALFPAYGNFVRFALRPAGIRAQPAFFALNVNVAPLAKTTGNAIRRDQHNNVFTYHASPTDSSTLDVPYHHSPDLLAQLLRDTLKREVAQFTFAPATAATPGARVVYSLPADTLYRRMMQESDNFLAEQLLLLSASTLSDTLSSERTIAYAQRTFLSDLPDKPVWVDGSGLSRYNLFTPRTLVALWLKLYQLVPRERLFALLATGGRSGTLRNIYQQENPFLFGKTGSLRNNHCLSGFLVTRSGKTLVFSFMHNNFVVPSSQIRKEIDRIMTKIYGKYE